MTSSFVCATLNLGRKKSTGTEPQPIRGQGGHLVFPIDPKNTNLVEDVEIYLPVKFCQILFSGFRGEVENVKVNDDGRTDDGRRTTDNA